MSRAGSVRKDPRHGSWLFVVDIAPAGGKRRQVMRRGFATKRAAQEALDELRGSVRAGAYVEPDRITLGAYLERWLGSLPAVGRRPSTISSYGAMLRRYVIGQPVGEVPLQALTPVELDELYASLLSSGGRTGAGRSPRTVRYLHSIIRKALEDALRKGLVSRNVARLASPPASSAARAPEAQVWEAAELGAFLEHVAGTEHGALFHVAAMTGLRRSEVCGLRWSDVDLEAGALKVRQALTFVQDKLDAPDETGRRSVRRLEVNQPKTKRSRREVALDPETVAVLRAHRREQLEARMLVGEGYRDQGLVFAMPDGSPWNPETVSQAFARVVDRLARAGVVSPITLHGLRHTHATLQLAAGVNPRVVSERLGHSSVAFTLDTYGHVLDGQQADAAAAVAALVAQARRPAVGGGLRPLR